MQQHGMKPPPPTPRTEDDDVRLLPSEHREGDARLLAARHGAHALQREVAADAEAAEVGARGVGLGAGEHAQREVQRREGEVQLVDVVLREARDAQLAVARHGARLRLQLAQDELQQGTLADAVRADDRDAAAGVHREVHPLEQRLIGAVPERHVVDLQDGDAKRARVRELELPLGIVVDLLQDVHPLQGLDARLDEGRALGVVPELVDERLDVLPLRLRVLRGALPMPPLLGARPLERVVVAPVEVELPAAPSS